MDFSTSALVLSLVPHWTQDGLLGLAKFPCARPLGWKTDFKRKNLFQYFFSLFQRCICIALTICLVFSQNFDCKFWFLRFLFFHTKSLVQQSPGKPVCVCMCVCVRVHAHTQISDTVWWGVYTPRAASAKGTTPRRPPRRQVSTWSMWAVMLWWRRLFKPSPMHTYLAWSFPEVQHPPQHLHHFWDCYPRGVWPGREVSWTPPAYGGCLIWPTFRSLGTGRVGDASSLSITLANFISSYPSGRRQWQPTPVLLPGKSHGQRSLVGYSPWGRKESDKTEQAHKT